MNYDAIRTAMKQCFPELSTSRLDWVIENIQKAVPPAKTALQARDELVTTILAHPEAELILKTADNLLALVTKPGMLLAFTLANAELAALHSEGELLAPQIAVATPQLLLDFKA